ncbi:MMPL family transporter [Streptomyces albipurpureus]|uniref:MMPL family transporter n=1 Tax=Streptomyces albipurpureus TaxID=2897419 RepID=A0ABT0UHF4_9ACTN|nr:MMPL family transporter [Streptomyces sp. CWNU-1]MCM2387751.1 MMPL family transporter [Streptomyces sp. CWNU-1]
MAVIARWCIRHRLVTVLLWVFMCAGVGAAAVAAGTTYSNDYEVPGTESGRAAELLADGFPALSGDTGTIVWHTETGSVRATEVQQRMSGTLDSVAALDSVADVTGPYQAAGAAQISPDGRTAYATVTFDQRSGAVPDQHVEQVVQTAQAARGGGVQVELGGTAIGPMEAPSGHLAETVGVAVAALVLFLAFGSLAASLLPIATALVSVGTAYAGIVLLGHVMTVADFAPMLGLLIGLGVGIDYALFIVTRHRKGLRAGLTVPDAAREAVTTTGRAVVFAGATVCIALLGMLILRLDFLNGVAIAASLTVVLTVAAAVTLLPALLSFIGMRALSGRERRRLAERGPEPELPTGFAARWSAFVERRPKLLALVAVAVMAVLALPTFSLHLGTSDQGNNPATSTTRQAYDLLASGGPEQGGEGGFGPGVNGPLTLVSRPDSGADRLTMDRLPEALRGAEGIASVGPVTYNASGDTAVLTVVPESSPQSKSTSELVDRLRDDLVPAALDGGSLKVHIGGVTAGYDDFAEIIVGKLPLFVGVVIALGCLLLLVAFRSIGIPLKAAAMNVAAVASSFGVVVAIFQWGWGSELLGLGPGGPIEPFLPVIMVSVLFGLSMDYQVFLVSRMYEEWLETGDNRRAVRVGLAETSRVINSAAVIMISVFLAFVLSGDRVIAMFGIALAAAVALDAFVLRTLLVPALMHMLGRANWWLPGWLDRRLPKITVEPRSAEASTPVFQRHPSDEEQLVP